MAYLRPGPSDFGGWRSSPTISRKFYGTRLQVKLVSYQSLSLGAVHGPSRAQIEPHFLVVQMYGGGEAGTSRVLNHSD